jgi:hypothetical protein
MQCDRVELTLRVSGNFLGVLFITQGDNTPELSVWNWKIGELILVIEIIAESVLHIVLISTPDTLQL